jgi:hypothetical protein
MLVNTTDRRSPPLISRKVKMHQAEILRKAGMKQRERDARGERPNGPKLSTSPNGISGET